MPIQYVIIMTIFIVFLIVGSIFLISVANHAKSKKQRLTFDSFRSKNIKEIFTLNRTEHRNPLYYLNLNMENSINKLEP